MSKFCIKGKANLVLSELEEYYKLLILHGMEPTLANVLELKKQGW